MLMSGSEHAQTLLREKKEKELQIHFTVRSTSFRKVWFQLTFCFRPSGSFRNFLGRVIDQLNPFTCNSKGLSNFFQFFLEGH
jgi:hypothetical protein